MRPFNPLNGAEVAQLLSKKVSDALARDERLREHLSYPLFDAKIDIKLTLHAGEPYPVELSVSAQEGDPAAKSAEPAVVELEERFEVGGTQETAPDRVREEAGLGIPTPIRMPGGRTVDKLVKKGARDG